VSDADDGFLSRWSRRKARVRSGLAEPAEAPKPVAAPAPAPTAAIAPAAPGAVAEAAVSSTAPDVPAAEREPLPTMEEVAGLTRSSDYSRFVGGGVDRNVSNAAMKKLFSDPHFNVMDGLDTYIDDYGKPDPIPPAMLRQLTQSTLLGLFDDEAAEAKPPDAANPPGPAASPEGEAALEVAQSGTGPPPPDTAPASDSDDDPDLRLQQDDGAGRPGIAPEPGA